MRVTPEIGDGLDSLAREAREATTAADKAQREAAARSREIARRLREAGLTGRDIAKVLDVSPQRVSQLLHPPRRLGRRGSAASGYEL